jgi:hypothetical protein
VSNANPRQRVWFAMKPGDTRDRLYDAAAGLLLRKKPEGTALLSLYIYPPGDGASEDTAVATVMWELSFEEDYEQGRHWDWGHKENERLAEIIRTELGRNP